MNLNRRNFIGGAGAIVAASALPAFGKDDPSLFPKRWDNFAPSQSQTLLQAKRELDFKSNPRFTSSGNGGSLKAKRRHRLGDENPRLCTETLFAILLAFLME